MELPEPDLELADRRNDHRQDQRGAIGVEEAIETASDAVVVEEPHLFGLQSQDGRIERRGPFPEGVERLAGHDKISQQESYAHARSQPQAFIIARQVRLEDIGDAHDRQEVIDDGKRPHGAGEQLERSGA